MNVNPLVISALSSLNFPVSPGKYEGTAEEYIVFNYADERPVLRADDADLADETSIQVHYFTRGNPQTNKKAIRRLLRLADFTITNTQEFYESDTKYNHVIVEAQIEGIIND
jgi:hypothetical protein